MFWRNHNLFCKYYRITLLGYMLFIHLYTASGGIVDESKNLEGNILQNQIPSFTNDLSNSKLKFQSMSAQETNNICLTPTCIHTASTILNNMNESVDPCDNFYQFACGKFIKSTIIPNDKSGITAFINVDDQIQQQLKLVLEENSSPNEPNVIKFGKEYYQICMNEDVIEEQGIKPLLRVLKNLGGWPVLEGNAWNETDFNWLKSIFQFRKMGYSTDYFINFNIPIDVKNNSRRYLELDQASLGISSKYLLEGLSNHIVKGYYDYMVDVSVELGANRKNAKIELLDALQFEISLANISLPKEKRRDSNLLYNPMTVKELSNKYSSIPWIQVFNTLLTNDAIDENERVSVAVPDYLLNFVELIALTPKRTQANYVMWRATRSSLSYLNGKINAIQLKFAKVVLGTSHKEARWKKCIDAVNDYFNIGVDALFIRNYFDKDAKKESIELVTDIRKRFYTMLQTIDWMDEKTKKNAYDKALSMGARIAYPDELLNNTKLNVYYKHLNLTCDSYLEADLKVTLYSMDVYFNSLRHPYDKNHWTSFSRSAVVNAYYSSIKNAISFPAGILQGVFFNKNRPKYMNYGGIGFIIGHEITHGFDDEGRQFNKDGNLIDWWDPDTSKKFLKKAQCIIDQNNNFTVEEVGMNLNGHNTQGETIADNGGLKMAYSAYNFWSERHEPEPQLPGLPFSQKQMFWLSAANIWCGVLRPESLKTRIMTGVHSPNEFRVLGSFQNMPEFAKDFQCPLGSKMNPIEKCYVW